MVWMLLRVQTAWAPYAQPLRQLRTARVPCVLAPSQLLGMPPSRFLDTGRQSGGNLVVVKLAVRIGDRLGSFHLLY